MRRLRQRAQEAEDLIVRVRSAAPDDLLDADAEHEEGLRSLIGACIECGLERIEHEGAASRPLPPAVTAQVRRAASDGMSLNTALHRCTTGFEAIWNVVLEESAHLGSAEHGRALLLEASSAMGSVLVHVQAEIAAAHSREIARRAATREQWRFEIVRKLLSSQAVPASELVELGYELNRWHLAVVARGAGARKVVQRLGAALGIDLLLLQCGEDCVWAWLGTKARLDGERVRRADPEIGRGEVSIAIGEPQYGLDGWRLTHREAASAALVARFKPAGFTRYADVAPEATALENPALAESLLEKYMTPLQEVEIGGSRARRALRALFDAKHNVSAAAHSLGVHRSTLHRWRNALEERLGPLHEHQTEIEIALRIEELRERHSLQ